MVGMVNLDLIKVWGCVNCHSMRGNGGFLLLFFFFNGLLGVVVVIFKCEMILCCFVWLILKDWLLVEMLIFVWVAGGCKLLKVVVFVIEGRNKVSLRFFIV